MVLTSSGLIPFAVAEFIFQHGLYGADSVDPLIREGVAPIRCGVAEPEVHGRPNVSSDPSNAID